MCWQKESLFFGNVDVHLKLRRLKLYDKCEHTTKAADYYSGTA